MILKKKYSNSLYGVKTSRSNVSSLTAIHRQAPAGMIKHKTNGLWCSREMQVFHSRMVRWSISMKVII